MSWDNVDDMFRELDEREYNLIAGALGNFRSSLMTNGFTRREALRLVETYSKFIYDMSIEEFLSQRRAQDREAYLGEWKEIDQEDDDDVDSEEEF